MNRIIISMLLIVSFSFSTYLQEGLYPDCSYVIVTDDGWKIHKNSEGRILSMVSHHKHDLKTGKYSFDRFGNLTSYVPCNNDENDFYSKTNSGFINSQPEVTSTEVEVEVSLDFGKILEKISVRAGGTMPFGDNINPPYAMGMHYGADIKVAQCPIFNRNDIILSLLGMYTPNDDSSLEPLTSNGIFLGYTLKLGKLFIEPSAGMLSQKGESSAEIYEVENGLDIGVKIEAGLNLGKISIYGGGIHTPTTFLGLEQTSAFFTAGLKYNF